jgi:biopolymer transport protein ExbB
MLELIDKGGIILVVIFALSIVAAAIIIERLWYFRRIAVDEEKVFARLRSTLAKGHYDEALSICDQTPSPITNLMRVGIEHRHHSQEVVKDAISDAANLEIPRMERFLSFLGTIGQISPLLGLLGTVTGNIQAFGVLGEFEAAGGNPALLAQGIAEALITTAAGIIVSIPAVIFYNYLVNKVNHSIIRLENRVTEMVLLFEEDRSQSSGSDARGSSGGHGGSSQRAAAASGASEYRSARREE